MSPARRPGMALRLLVVGMRGAAESEIFESPLQGPIAFTEEATALAVAAGRNLYQLSRPGRPP